MTGTPNASPSVNYPRSVNNNCRLLKRCSKLSSLISSFAQNHWFKPRPWFVLFLFLAVCSGFGQSVCSAIKRLIHSGKEVAPLLMMNFKCCCPQNQQELGSLMLARLCVGRFPPRFELKQSAVTVSVRLPATFSEAVISKLANTLSMLLTNCSQISHLGSATGASEPTHLCSPTGSTAQLPTKHCRDFVCTVFS